MNDISRQEPDVKSRLFAGAIWITAAKVVSLVISLASTILLARLLVPDDFGLVAIATAIAQILVTVTELSLSQALIQHDEPEEGHYHTAFTMGVLRSLILALIMFASAYPLSLFYGDARLTELIWVLGLSCFIGGFMNPKLVNFARQLEFKQNVMNSLVEKVTAFIVAAVIAVLFRTYWALVLGVLASQVARVANSYLLTSYRPRFSLSHSRELMGFSIWVTLGSWVQTLNWRSDPLLIGYFASTASLGQLNMADRVSKMAVGEMVAPITSILFPAFSRFKSDPNRLKAAYLNSQASLCSLVFPVAIGLALVAKPVVTLLIGEKWLPSVPLMQILSVSLAIQYTQNIQPIAMALGRTKVLFERDVRALFIRVPIMVTGVLVGYNTELGVVMGAVIAQVFAGLINQWLNMNKLVEISGISMRDQLKVLLRPFLAVCVMTVAAILVDLEILSDFPETSRWIEIAAIVSVGVLTYLATLIGLWVASGKPYGPEQQGFEYAGKLVKRVTRTA